MLVIAYTLFFLGCLLALAVALLAHGERKNKKFKFKILEHISQCRTSYDAPDSPVDFALKEIYRYVDNQDHLPPESFAEAARRKFNDYTQSKENPDGS